MKRDEVSIGDAVCVAGYAGWAEVLHIDQDGEDLHGNPKYRATVKWGPNNDQYGVAKRCAGGSGLIEDYALGRLYPTTEDIYQSNEERKAAEFNDSLQSMTQEEIQAALADIEKELQAS